MKYCTTSLQNLCLIEVIKYLEYYPPELLACLPPTLRQLLLVHMPIVDHCQLENTCMFDGVDTETVWKERYEQQTLRYTSLIASAGYFGLTLSHVCIVSEPERFLDRFKTMKEKYFAAIIYSILECARPTGYYQSDLYEAATFGDIDLKKYGLLDHPVDIVNYLVAAAKIERALIFREPCDESYSNPDEIYFEISIPEYELSECDVQLMNHCTYMNANELYQEVPPRYSSYLNEENHCRLSEEDALMLLMEKCDYYAEDMYINIVRCGAIRWKWEQERVKSLIGHFFSKMFKLELCCCSDDTVTCTGEALKHILNAVLSSSSLQLFSLTILEANDDHINAIAPLLSNPNVPCRIEELHLDCITLGDFNSANALGDIFSSQTNISSLNAYCLKGTIAGSRFTTGIVDLLQRPSMKRLSLKLVTFSSKELQTLITTFLTTPCSQVQSVQLHISLTDSASSGLGQRMDIPQSTLEYKSLEIGTCRGYNINSWLFSLLPLKLKSLCIFGVEVNGVQYVNGSTLALAACNSSLHVRYLNLETTDFSTEDFQTLLRNESLKELTIVPTGPVGLGNITHGLLKLSETRTLEKLTVNSFTLNSPHRIFGYVKPSSRDEVEQFSETLFSLPHLNCFSLELCIKLDPLGLDTTDFIETMFKSWEKKSKKPRLKKFVLNFLSKVVQLPPLEENLQTMAEEIGMKVNFKVYLF